MSPHSIVRVLAAAAMVAAPSFAMAAPNQIAQGYPYNGGCVDGRWVNGQCVPDRDWRTRERHELNATVASFSPYNLYLFDGMHVELHNGTVINPTGTTLRRGMRVQVYGYRSGDGSFRANEIDVVGWDHRGY